jgi:DNA (cytosine-5)-methyltransferase 1
MGKGMNTTCDEGQTAVIAFGGQMSSPQVDMEISQTLQRKNPQAVATPIDLRQSSRGDKATNNRSKGSGGLPGHGLGHDSDPAFIVSERGQAVVCGDGHTVGTLRSNTRNNSDPVTEAAMHVMHGMAVRRLTPRECERLQGFPDDYTAIPFRGKPAADGPRYRALGNSMAVPVMAWIGSRIADVNSMEIAP